MKFLGKLNHVSSVLCSKGLILLCVAYVLCAIQSACGNALLCTPRTAILEGSELEFSYQKWLQCGLIDVALDV